MAFNIVLCNPEIPQNTGNIVRTCAVTGSRLHLVRPLGFEVTDRHLKRAGLDYWHFTPIFYYDSFKEVVASMPSEANLHLATAHTQSNYSEAVFCDGDYIVFGCETCGLSPEIRDAYPQRCLRIPMRNDTRSLNLSNSVAIVLYEALRQGGFAGLL